MKALGTWLAGVASKLPFLSDADQSPLVAGVVNGISIGLAFFVTFIVWGIIGTAIATLFGAERDLLLIPILLVLGGILLVAWAAVSRRLTSRVIGAIGVPSRTGNTLGFFSVAVLIYLIISLCNMLISLG